MAKPNCVAGFYSFQYWLNCEATAHRTALSKFLWSLSLSNIKLNFHSFKWCCPASGTSPLLISIYTITLPWQFLLAPTFVFSPVGSPSESCILHHHFLCQFSQSHWPLLLIITCAFHSLSSTHTASFLGYLFALRFTWTCCPGRTSLKHSLSQTMGWVFLSLVAWACPGSR